MKKVFYAGMLIAIMVCASFAGVGRAAEEAPRITKEEVKALLGGPGIVILDARTGLSWSKSDKKIKSAVRVDPDSVDSWAGGIPKDKKVVVYCS